MSYTGMSYIVNYGACGMENTPPCLVCGVIVLYSGKLLREKTFLNFFGHAIPSGPPLISFCENFLRSMGMHSACMADNWGRAWASPTFVRSAEVCLSVCIGFDQLCKHYSILLCSWFCLLFYLATQLCTWRIHDKSNNIVNILNHNRGLYLVSQRMVLA